MKLKLDKDSLKELLLEHVEKICFGVAVVVSLYFLYAAFTLGSFDRTPEYMKSRTGAARKAIENGPKECDLTVTDYVERAKQSRLRVDEKLYIDGMVPWVWPVSPAPSVRHRPNTYAVRELRGAANVGAFNMKKKDSEGRITRTSATVGQRWIVITGLVPIKEQFASFEANLKDAQDYDPGSDMPEYKFYIVERAEVGDVDESGKLKWSKTINSWDPAMAESQKQWGSTSAEIVDPVYTHPVLTGPLGPWTNGAWGEEVAHVPDVKLFSSKEFVEGDRGEPVKPVGPVNPLILPGPGPGVEKPVVPGSKDIEEGSEEPDYALFRFFDYDVKPGKSYRYRVRLLLVNPNAKDTIEKRYLDERLQEQKEKYEAAVASGDNAAKMRATLEWKYLQTEWSESSDPISVPKDTRVLAVSVNPAKRVYDSPSAKLLLVKWLEDSGEEVYEAKSGLPRGKVANFLGEKFTPGIEDEEDGKRKTPKRTGDGVIFGRPMEKAGDDVEEESFEVDYETEAIVLDMRGGEDLPGDGMPLREPGRIVLLDADGNIVVRDEIDDLDEFERLTLGVEEEEPFDGDDPREQWEKSGPGEFEGFPPGFTKNDRPGARIILDVVRFAARLIA